MGFDSTFAAASEVSFPRRPGWPCFGFGNEHVNQDSPNLLTKTLAFASVAEIATALALVVDPALVVRLLLGVEATDLGIPLARFLGIALFALGIACWPNAQRSRHDTAAYRGMLTYNTLVALFLAWVFIAGHIGGVLLWPAVVVHAVVTVLMLRTWIAEPRVPQSGNGPQ